MISVSGGGSPGRISKKELGQIKILKRFEFNDIKNFENYF